MLQQQPNFQYSSWLIMSYYIQLHNKDKFLTKYNSKKKNLYFNNRKNIFLNINISSMSKLVLLIILAFISIHISQSCIHDTFALNTTKHFLNDLTDKRLLTQQQVGRLRIFVDYTLLTTGGAAQINTIKRVVNITANYFYNFLNVTRLERLYFPKSTSRVCNSIEVPQQYVINGTIGDVGVICSNQNSQQAVYVAKSTPCAFLESTKRPIWGMITFNNAYLKFDQVGFQEIIFVSIHEMIHVLGFSAILYELYPGNALVTGPNGQYYLNSPKIQEQIKKYYGCDKFLGFPLQDQDGTLIGSHWEKKVIGNEIMISSVKKGAFLHPVTAALFQTTGFYHSVNYAFVESTVWGKNKGCDFLNIDICQGDEFCQNSNFDCDSQATGIGKCSTDPYTGSCKLQKYYTNTICVDQNYEVKNLNAKLNALERGGASSRCFFSDFRQQGVTKSKLDFRCYTSVCSSSGKFIYLMVGSYVLICRNPGQKLPAPPGLEGSLTCPTKFDRYCQSKKSCPYHCNKNGACIDGKCLCTGSTQFSSSCIDISIYLAPIGSTGGLLNAIIDTDESLNLDNDPLSNSSNGVNIQKKRQVREYSLDSKCIQGTVYDPTFGQCIKCIEVFKCEQCNQGGCLVCDNGKRPVGNKCSF